MRIDTIQEAYDYLTARVPVWNGLPRASIIGRREHEMPGDVMSVSGGNTPNPVIEVNIDQIAGCSNEYVLGSLGHEIGHLCKWRPGDGHDSVWELGMWDAGLEPIVTVKPDGTKKATERVIPGGHFDIAMREFLAGARASNGWQSIQRPSHATPCIQRFGPDAARGAKHFLMGDCSGSMSDPLRDGVSKMDAQKNVIAEVWSGLRPAPLVGAFAGTAILKSHPSEVYWNSGCEGGTSYTPIFLLANELDVEHLHLFSDGEPHESEIDIFAARSHGRYKISTYFFGFKGSAGADLMERLARGGKAHVIDTTEGLRAAVYAETGAQRMANEAWGGGPDLSGEIKGALQVVGDRVALHGHLVDVAGRVNNVAERVGIVEDRLKIGRAMTVMLQQLDRHTAEALEAIGGQYSAAEQHRLARSQQLDTVLLSSGSEMGRMSQQHIGGALVNYANDAHQMMDRSAPPKIPLVALDASVISRANALLAGGQARAPELPRPVQPVQQHRESLGVPVNQQAIPAPQRAMVPSRWGE